MQAETPSTPEARSQREGGGRGQGEFGDRGGRGVWGSFYEQAVKERVVAT